MQSLRERIYSLYCAEKLAHFYTIQLNQNNISQKNFARELLHFAYQNQNSNDDTEFSDHSDILIISPEDNRYNASSEKLQEYKRTWEFKPTSLKYRFFVFLDAQKIGKPILNKMLKQLEEPPAWSCIFFINAGGSALLPTIESRAIKYSAPIKYLDNQKAKTFPAWLEQAFIHFSDANSQTEKLETNAIDAFKKAIAGEQWDFIEILKKQPELESSFLKMLLELCAIKIRDFKTLQRLCDDIQSIERSAKFSNFSQTRAFQIIELWKMALHQMHNGISGQ